MRDEKKETVSARNVNENVSVNDVKHSNVIDSNVVEPDKNDVIHTNVVEPYEKIASHTVALKSGDENTVQPKSFFSIRQSSLINFSETEDDEISFPTKSGFLQKLSGGKKRNPKWDLRYFELTTAGYLHYSKKQDGKLSGSIYLRGSPVIIDPSNACIVTIEHAQREWKLRSNNELDTLDWYNAFIYYAQMDEIDV